MSVCRISIGRITTYYMGRAKKNNKTNGKIYQSMQW